MSRIHLLTVTRFAAALAIALPMLGLGTASASDASVEASPNIAVTLTSDADTVAAGERITYTAEIINKGEALHARVVLTPPQYATVGSIEGAEVVDNEVTWAITLGAAETKTLEIPARIGEIPDTELRVTTLLSLYVGDSTRPLVRTASAAHIDGVQDVQVVSSPQPSILLWGGIGLLIVLASLAVVIVLLQRRRHAAEEAARRGPAGVHARRHSAE